jgi:dTDP-4-amino-4,6-dideoxygalactose transaminase
VIEVLQSGNLVQGAFVEQFEQALCRFADLPYAAVVSSGTAALHLALLALGIGPGDAVIVPAFTFPATANVVERVGARTILCDVDPRTYVATTSAIESTLDANRDANVRAIMLVHEFGFPAPVREIARLAADRGVTLIEDAACAMGTIADGHHPGYYSEVACLSFHPRKAVTTGEGGALLSRNQSLINSVQRLRNHGIDTSPGSGGFVAAGLNYRMTEFQAALALGQTERFPEELLRRRRLAGLYCELLGDGPVALPQIHPGHSWQTFMVVLDPGMDRQGVIEGMRARDVQCNFGAHALNRLEYYRTKYGLEDADFPVATRLYSGGLALPLYGKLQDTDMATVASCLAAVLKNA